MKKGWQGKRIGEVCRLMTGGTPNTAKPDYFGGEVKWLVSGDIHQGEIFDCEGRITEAGMSASNAKLLPVNSVIIALNGQGKTRGTVALLRTRATCNQSLVSIYPNDPDTLLPEFLYANLHGRYQEIRQMTGDGGNDRRGLNMPLIRSIEIPIAPVPEQQRIVNILDEAWEGIATAKANTEKNLQNARALFESHLQSILKQCAFRWEEKTLAEICSKITDGEHLRPRVTTSGVPFLSAKDVLDQDVVFKDALYVSEEDAAKFRKRCDPGEGDILIVSRGATVGRACVVRTTTPFCLLGSVILLKVRKDFSSSFVSYVLKSPVIHNQLVTASEASAQQAIYLRDIQKIRIVCPQLFKQQEIVSLLDAFATEAERLKSVYKQKLSALEELKQSLSHAAFNGEL
jgi:type I restriction enzyme S subunit